LSDRRSDPCAELKVGNVQGSLLIGAVLADLGVRTPGLRALVVRELTDVVRRSGRIQTEQPGGSTLSMHRCHGCCRREGDEGQCAECDARKAGVQEEFRHDDIFLSVDAQLKDLNIWRIIIPQLFTLR
jgi:hypothetical protein